MSRKKASTEQLAYLSDFMTKHPEMTTGHHGSLQERAHAEQRWSKLVNKLNALEGPKKTAAKWKQAWRDLRHNCKRKATLDDFRDRLESTGNVVTKIKSELPVYDAQEEFANEPLEAAPETPRPLARIPPEVCFVSLLPEPGTSHTRQPLRVEPPTEPTRLLNNPRKRRRIVTKQDHFNAKLLILEEVKLQIEKERNEIMTQKNRIAEENNSAINRIADVLQDFVNNINKTG